MNNEEYITVLAAGRIYTGFTNVKITASIKEAARTFTLTTTDVGLLFRMGDNFQPDSKVEIYANGDLVVRGAVDVFEPDISPEDHPVIVSGRGKGRDFVDSSAEHEKGYIEHKSLDQIGKKLDKFGVGISASETLKPIEYHQITPGQSCFMELDAHCREQGVTAMGKADGSIEYTKSKKKRHAGGLIEGVNIIKGRAKFNGAHRYSDITVKGQKKSGTKEKELRTEGKAKDAGVKSYRPLVIRMEKEAGASETKKRAASEKNRRAGEATRATIGVQGWRDGGGKLFEPSHLIYTSSKTLKIEQDMVIEKINWEQDAGSNGSLSSLDIVDPRAYGGKKPGTVKSSKVWSDGFKETDPVGVGDGSL